MSKIPALERYPDYEVVIGIEVHVQLTTKSKIFCSCSNEPAQQPNSNICSICTGHPGVLPMLNKQVVDHAILAGLATNCEVTRTSYFARKHYFYPDLPKNYQITQSDVPICSQGFVSIRLEDGSEKKIRIMRIHMEEDAGKNIHATHTNESFVDLNRTGTPLLEIVTHPDISSAYQARAYLKMLRLIVQYLNICSGNMEEGAFRADTNISVRKKGATVLGTRCELKNINSFKFISDAIEYEIERQITTIEQGGIIKQETRLWDTKTHQTTVMRSKEEAADYRYLPDPDLPLITIDDAWLAQMRAKLPELPHQKYNRFVQENGLTTYEAEIFVEDPALAHYYELALRYNKSRQVVNWILRDLLGYLKEHKQDIGACKVTPEKLALIVGLVEKSTINNHAAKQLFERVAQTGQDPLAIVKQEGLEQVDSSEELEKIIKEIIAAHPENAAEFKAGKQKLFGFFVGLAMQKTGGKGNPKTIQELLKKHLG
jgi:aspartyl-tRNA(Asn)/glutamyl-tRNA(Gln) amidotransferase subunit B